MEVGLETLRGRLCHIRPIEGLLDCVVGANNILKSDAVLNSITSFD